MTLRNQLQYFFGAIRFFTRLPVPAQIVAGSGGPDRSMRYFPTIGLIVGAVAALGFVLSSMLWPRPLAVLASMTITLGLTGALHENGWRHMVDGFGGGWGKARILEIMKDSRVGSYGAVALTMLLLARFCALVEIDLTTVPLALISAHAISRLCAMALLVGLDQVPDGSRAEPWPTRPGYGELTFAALTALLPALLLPLGQALPGLLFAALATLWLAGLFKREIGGCTGDCLGATQQLAEVAFYTGMLCRFT